MHTMAKLLQNLGEISMVGQPVEAIVQKTTWEPIREQTAFFVLKTSFQYSIKTVFL